ncbi:hypothetical protein ACT2FY_37700 [Paraburkholderia fungorum]|jgi:hypothetical protein|uniref:Uncharacterized protein n=1 Tax=Caballeronia udeis TaxID=1232866 RepID=A0A158GKY2_9BURK|nr:hypothetical protein [Caballeronia udeis]SAL32603.1 hypothetical protein AWB69_02859 [Caballeronia udeis]
MKNTLLRRIAAHFTGADISATFRVMHTWRRPEDDVRAVRLETVINGNAKRVTLYRHAPGKWSLMPL